MEAAGAHRRLPVPEAWWFRMIDFLKPTKANVVGTIALLAANWAGGLITRYAVAPAVIGAMGGTMQNGGRGAFGAGGTAGAGMMQFGNFGLVSGALSLVILAVLFYVIVSFTIVELAKSPESQKTKS